MKISTLAIAVSLALTSAPATSQADHEKPASPIRRAAAASGTTGDLQLHAVYRLGMLFRQTTDNPTAQRQAFRLLRKCAYEGLDKAQYALGLMYLQQAKGPEDSGAVEKARFWLGKAADQGHAQALSAYLILEDEEYGIGC